MVGDSQKGNENHCWIEKTKVDQGEILAKDQSESQYQEGSSQSGGAQKNGGNNSQFKFEGKCYNCGKKGHIAIDCWSKKKSTESSASTSNLEKQSNEEWDLKASFATEEEEMALTVVAPGQIDYKNDWIIDSGCSNHMTGGREKLKNMTEYK